MLLSLKHRSLEAGCPFREELIDMAASPPSFIHVW